MKESTESIEFVLDESKDLKLKIPNDVIKIHKLFKKNGKKLYVVGGAVRDAILGKSPKDFDVATDAKPDEVEKIARDNGIKTKPVGKQFGVVLYIINGVEYEIATFRKDIGKGRRPSSVDYTDIKGDVKRRDLTVNALFYDIDKKEIVDLVGGIADLKNKNIRTVGKAKERFDEDPLRKLRALRFWTRMGGKLDKELLDALQDDSSLKGISSERIRDEFIKSIKSSKNTEEYMDMCDKIGFTSQIFPNLKVSKPYPKTNDFILFLAWILRENSPIVLNRVLNEISYTKKEIQEIVYLINLQDFEPENIISYKKKQSESDDNRIIAFGKMIGKDMKKFVNFKLSLKGADIPSDLKGPEKGQWIKNKEKENFMKKLIESIKSGSEKARSELNELLAQKVKVLVSEEKKNIAKNILKEESITEDLDPNSDAKVWIDDFVKSDAPQFKGKTKEQRVNMALGAYYSARKEAGLEESIDLEEATFKNKEVEKRFLTLKKMSSSQLKKAHSDAVGGSTSGMSDEDFINDILLSEFGIKKLSEASIEESDEAMGDSESMSEDEKAKVLKSMLKAGSNKKDAEELIKTHYDYVSGMYKNTTPSKKAEIIVTLGATDQSEQVDISESVMDQKMWDKIKKGDKLTISYDDSISGGNKVTLVVVSKNIVGKQRVGKMTMKRADGSSKFKFYIYNRDGKMGLAIGNLAASMTDVVMESEDVEDLKEWGSSDWYSVIKSMDKYLKKAGVNPDTITQAAQDQADFYYDDMGYDSAEDAVPRIIDMWKIRSKTGQKLMAMFGKK